MSVFFMGEEQFSKGISQDFFIDVKEHESCSWHDFKWTVNLIKQTL